MVPATSPSALQADLIRVDYALNSMRDAGFDLSTAGGEIVDNSIEGKATSIRIRTVEGQIPQGQKSTKAIVQIAFADNGIGIPHEILANSLTLGFSTRYNERNGLGRFGVGMKLASISQARRVDIYTQPLGDSHYYHAYLDLDEVASGKQTHIQARPVENYPPEFADLMQVHKKETPFESGTLVIWSKVDRLTGGGRYGSSLDEYLQEFTKFLARAYRKFIDSSLSIELNGREITLHDPLFLLDTPRAAQALKSVGENPESKATVLEETDFEIDGHKVHVTVTVYPEGVRRTRGKGGMEERLGEAFKSLYIPENEGRVSILRHGREIYYDIIPRLFPGGVQFMDRFIGVEIAFPAALDEYFQVRHVKRGAEPVSKLRQQVRQTIDRPIRAARQAIQATWDETARQDRDGSKDHQQAQEAVQQAEQTSPRGRAGSDLSPAETEQLVMELLADLIIDPVAEPERAHEIRARIKELPITLVDGGWPGKELIEITHLNGKAIVRFNHRHLFMKEVYQPVQAAAKRDSIEPDEALRLLRRVEIALDVMFMAYAKAENMHAHPDVYDDLRSYWGQFTQAYIREALASEQME